MTQKLFTKYTLALTAAGLLLNIALVWLTEIFSIPLYLDSIGTVVVAALCGALPGIAVGFLSNCLTAFLSVSPDAMTLYYGFLNVLIAVAAAWFSKKGLLLKWYGRICIVFVFAFIGGALGSLITWMLYGFSFGAGVSAPLASFYYRSLRLSEFPAQFVADMSVDLADKLITTVALSAALRLIPNAALCKLPLGYIYQNHKKRRTPAELHEKIALQLGGERLYRKRSINSRITMLIIVSSTILSVIAVTIGVSTYRNRLIAQYSDVCYDAVCMMLPKLDGDRAEEYLAKGEAASGYSETERDLRDIFENVSQLKYMYVYQIQPDGCHVVFDLDTESLAGEEAGAVVPFDEAFPYLERILNGEEIPPFISSGAYGWLLTVYQPVYDSNRNVVAYAAADIDMESIKTDIYSYLISVISLLFGALMLITTFCLWYLDKRLLDPIGVLTEQARDFDYDGDHEGDRVRDKYAVKTGDELEELFGAMCKTEDAFAAHVAQIHQKNLEISRMQQNIIYTLANMVENRDGNTGGHIKRTANYVRLIGRKLEDEGLYADVVNDGYVKMLYDSAPLHDIGKIKIPDAILNKPGRLTREEFDVMKTHATEGRDILQTSLSGIEDNNWLSMAMDMATYHHEKWSGGGYPEGLRGEAIPLCARIMAVSDVFDALVTARSYKSAYSFEEAMAIIQEEAGTHFDPVIARVFIAAGDEAREIAAMGA